MTTIQAQHAMRLESEPSLPLWREAFMGADWLSLRLSPVYYGFGVPRGNGSPVIVIPGFLGSDNYLNELYNWLRRIGYQPYYSRIGLNADCLNILMQRIFVSMDQAYENTGRKLHLIGHSLGGLLARSAATQRPDQVAQVITLASPFRSIRTHPLIISASDWVRNGKIKNRRENGEVPPDCYTDQCPCQTAASLRSDLPKQIERLAVYTKADGVVEWACCVDEDPTCNVEVFSTHTGLAFHPASFRAIGEKLAECRVEDRIPA